MNDYVLLVPTVATSFVAVAFALMWRHEQIEREARESDLFIGAGKSATEIQALKAQLADREEGIAERDAEIKALRMQTVEMPQVETAAPIPARPKRTARKKMEEAS